MNESIEEIGIHACSVGDIDLQPCRAKRRNSRRDLLIEIGMVERSVDVRSANCRQRCVQRVR
jgi:hypothetical protein